MSACYPLVCTDLMTVSLSDPALARIEGQVVLSQASTNFKANAAIIRAKGERSERLLYIAA